MASDNETVTDIVKEMHDNANTVLDDRHDEDCWSNIEASEIYRSLADRIESAHRREVAELRECLEQAVVYFCGNDKLADCIEKVYGNPKCETEGQHCMVERWRTALEGAKDEGK